MTTPADEGIAPVEFFTVFSHPDFDPDLDAPVIATPVFDDDFADAPQIAVPNFEPDPEPEPPAPPQVSPPIPTTERAESATPKEL